MNTVNEVTITLPIATIDACLTALSKFPYEQAAQHIDLLRAVTTAALKAGAPAQVPQAGPAAD